MKVLEGGSATAVLKALLQSFEKDNNMAKVFSPLMKKLLAIGVKEHAKTASENEISELLKIGVAMDEGESEGADADEHPKGCKCADCKDSKGKHAKGKDAKAEDARKRMHDALDRMLDSKDDEQAAQDADMDQLRGLLSGGAGSEKTKTTPGVDGEEEESEVNDEEGEGEDGEEDEEGEGADEAVETEASKPLSESQRAKSPAPSAVDSIDAATVLKALKPFVAKANDKRLNKAFDTASQFVRGTAGKSSKGGYRAVSQASKAVGKDAADQLETRNRGNKIAEDANAEYRKMRGVNTTKK